MAQYTPLVVIKWFTRAYDWNRGKPCLRCILIFQWLLPFSITGGVHEVWECTLRLMADPVILLIYKSRYKAETLAW